MGKQTKQSFFHSKKFIKFGKYSIFLLVLGLIVFLIFLPTIQKKRKENFKKNAKSLNVCALVENKYMIERNPMDGRADTSIPVVVFKVDDLRCKYSPSVKEWAGFKVGQDYFIQGRSASTRCKIEKIEKGCELNGSKETLVLN